MSTSQNWLSRLRRKTSCEWYIACAAWILLLTSGAKLYSALGKAKLLDLPEALLPITYRQTLCLAGLIELAITIFLLFGKNQTIKLTAIAWLGWNFVLYRLGVMFLTVGKPCPCLGTITEKLPFKPATIDRILTVVVFYLVLGSWFFLSTRRNQQPPSPRAKEVATGGLIVEQDCKAAEAQ